MFLFLIQKISEHHLFLRSHNWLYNSIFENSQMSEAFLIFIGSRERRKKTSSNKLNSKLAQPGGPPIPEPDYSCTDSEGETEDIQRKTADTLASRINSIQLQATENSGNSNAR